MESYFNGLVLPTGTRMVFEKKAYDPRGWWSKLWQKEGTPLPWRVLIIEKSPHVRSVVLKEEGKKEFRHVRIGFPYLLFRWCNRFGLSVAYRNEPLKSMDDLVYPSNLPHVHGLRGMCLGDARRLLSGTFRDQIESHIKAFWESAFQFGPTKIPDGRLASWDLWAANTKEDPFFPLTVAWPQGQTLKVWLETQV